MPGTHRAVIGDKNPAILGIKSDAMRIGQTRGVALQQSKRGCILVRILFEHDHRAVVLQSEVHLLRSFVNGYPKCSVGRVQFPIRRRVSFGAAIEDDQAIHGIVVDRIDAAVFGVDVEYSILR